jgi:adenylate cyclase
VRGVACALGLCKVAARHNLTGRVGIAAGPVFAGPLGAPQRREYAVIGDTVNLAARLMQNAGHGEVFLDQTVQTQAYRFFEFKDLGLVPIKGKNEPRHIYSAQREKEQEDAEPHLVKAVLTGREKELEFVDAISAKARAGHGQVLLLVGDAGVGKSRLASEIARRWLESGGKSHSGACVSHGRHTPYLPWRGILTFVAGLAPNLSVEERVARLQSMLKGLPPPVSTPDVSLSDDYWLQRLPLLAGIMGLECKDTSLTHNLGEGLRRDNGFATLKALMLEEARRQPLLILLEDTHSSDELSLELTAFLASELSNAAILLLFVHRPMPKPTPLSYQRLLAMPHASQLVVSELDPEASLQLVKNRLGVADLPPELAALIRRKGQGNPFFIEELINSLVGMHALKVENGRCVMVGDLGTLELPDTVQKVVLARIDRLKDAEKMTLKVAAAIGRTFQRDLVEAVHPWLSSSEALNHQLAHLQAEDFTRQEARDSDPEFLFKHIITQEVAYETMLYSQREQLHATLGDVLEARPNSREIIDLLAYHYSRSDNREKAMSYLCRAGEKALNGYANAAAISYFTEALKIAEKLGNVAIQLESFAGREKAYNRLGNRAAQGDDLTRMKKLASLHHAMDQYLEAGNRQVQLAMNVGDYNGALAMAEETLALARREGKSLWEARVLTTMGITYWRQGLYDNARGCMLKALDSQGAIDDPRLKAVSLNYLGLIGVQISEYEQARNYYQQALEIYRTLSDKTGEAGCANNIGLLESSLGNYAEAQQAYAQAYALCHTIGDRLLEGISLNLLGQVCTILGHFPLGKEHLDHSLAIRRAIGDRRGEAFCLHDLGHFYLDTGEPEQAIAMFAAATEIRRSLGETGNYVASLAAKGTAHSRQGQHDTARLCLQETVDRLEQGSGSGEYPVQNVWWSYAQLCRAEGQNEAARHAIERAYRQVKAKADQIRTPTLRSNYLENVRVNAAIVKAMEGELAVG